MCSSVEPSSLFTRGKNIVRSATHFCRPVTRLHNFYNLYTAILQLRSSVMPIKCCLVVPVVTYERQPFKSVCHACKGLRRVEFITKRTTDGKKGRSVFRSRRLASSHWVNVYDRKCAAATISLHRLAEGESFPRFKVWKQTVERKYEPVPCSRSRNHPGSGLQASLPETLLQPPETRSRA